MAQDGALVLALDGEVDAFAEARAVNCRFPHVERDDFYNVLVEMVYRERMNSDEVNHHHRPESPRDLPRPRLRP